MIEKERFRYSRIQVSMIADLHDFTRAFSQQPSEWRISSRALKLQMLSNVRAYCTGLGDRMLPYILTSGPVLEIDERMIVRLDRCSQADEFQYKSM